MKLKKLLKTTQNFSVIKYSQDTPSKAKIEVIVEQPFQILINDQVIATIMATPIHLEEFLIGFLIGQGITQAPQIEKTMIEEDKGLLWAQVKDPKKVDLTKSMITSGCSGGINLDNFDDIAPLAKSEVPEMGLLGSLMKEMLVNSYIYSQAGGVHSACLADNNGIIFKVEDIGRHNCIDKVIGYIAKNRIDTEGKFILTTGRISLEAIPKVVRSKVNVLASRSTPTNLAVELAKKLNLNLLGYVRLGKLTIYSP